MRAIPRPTFGVGMVVAVMETSPEVTLAAAVAPLLDRAEAAYRTLGEASLLYKMPARLSVLSEVEHLAVKWTYSNRLAAQKKNARMYYEVLKELSGEFECPSCLRREVDELDHYLPKSKFPYLAVVPLNLVPICSKCNKKKQAFVATTADDQPLHPYFDDLGGFDWLVAVLDEASGALRFTVDAPSRWSAVLAARVAAHFTRHELGSLYSKQASRFLGNIRGDLTSRFYVGGARAVQMSILDLERTWRAAGFEPWTVAALKAWGDSDWFCGGGFGLLALDPDDLPSASEPIDA